MTPENISTQTITLTFDSKTRTVRVNDSYTIKCSASEWERIDWEMKCGDEFMVWFWALSHWKSEIMRRGGMDAIPD